MMRTLFKYDDYTQEVLIANSEGLLCLDVRPLVLIMAVAIATDEEEVRIRGFVLTGRSSDVVLQVSRGRWCGDHRDV